MGTRWRGFSAEWQRQRDAEVSMLNEKQNFFKHSVGNLVTFQIQLATFFFLRATTNKSWYECSSTRYPIWASVHLKSPPRVVWPLKYIFPNWIFFWRFFSVQNTSGYNLDRTKIGFWGWQCERGLSAILRVRQFPLSAVCYHRFYYTVVCGAWLHVVLLLDKNRAQETAMCYLFHVVEICHWFQAAGSNQPLHVMNGWLPDIIKTKVGTQSIKSSLSDINTVATEKLKKEKSPTANM